MGSPRSSRFAFAFAAALLLGGAAALWAVLITQEIHLLKQPVPMRLPLVTLPEQIGNYQKTNHITLRREMVDELGTDRYILWDFRDTRPGGSAGGSTRLLVAYYTGKQDSNPHFVDHCFVIPGIEPREVKPLLVPLRSESILAQPDGSVAAIPPTGDPIRLPGVQVPMSVFKHATDVNKSATIAYFYYANGRWLATSQEVRQAVTDPRASSAYWCRIEVMIDNSPDPAAALSPFLSAVLPRVMACLPTVPPTRALAQNSSEFNVQSSKLTAIPLPNSLNMGIVLVGGIAICTRFKSRRSRKHY